MNCFSASASAGSSPLTRGKRQRHRGRHQGNGLIPAHAGKTTGRGLRAQQGRAHPRSRGENTANGQTWGLGVGSSPLTRGKPAGRAAGQAVAGLIPAHAGKTSSQRRSPTMRRAHPRSRGENQIQVLKAHMGDGSSPLTRGKLIADRITGKTIGLIPAHAGKTSRTPRCVRMSRAHPRSRGENA